MAENMPSQPPPLPAKKRRTLITVWIVAIVASTILYAPYLIFKPFKFPSGSMYPTLIPHDCVYANMLAYAGQNPERGDIVVFKTDDLPLGKLKGSHWYVKRVVGLPGERVRIDAPNLFVNGQRVKEPAFFARMTAGKDGYGGYVTAPTPDGMATLTNSQQVVTIPADRYFVLGDNSRNSFDSRYWGCVPRRNIHGKAVAIYWPPDRIQSLRGK